MRVLAVVPLALASTSIGYASDARACGGCFHEPPTDPSQSGTVVTDHRMLFVVSPQQTTLYDEIEYSGSPSSFAWVLPVRGAVKVGLSSDTVFSLVDSFTAATIVPPPAPPPCPTPPVCFCDEGDSGTLCGDAVCASDGATSNAGPGG